MTRLCDLPDRLRAAGYVSHAVGAILRRGLLDVTQDVLPGLIRRCREADSPAGRLTAFWLLLEPLPAGELESLLGRELVHLLLQWTVVQREGSMLRAGFSLVPLLDAYFFADPLLRPGPAPWLSAAGYALALATPRSRVSRAADLQLGAGVHAILNSAHTGRSWGRCSPESWACCQLNLQLNPCSCRFVETEEELPGGLDLLTGRLPGDEVSRIAELAGRLRVGGTLALAIRHDLPLVDRVEGWLDPTGWGLAELSYATRELEFHPSGARESVLFLRRLEPARPNWRAARSLTLPQEPLSDLVESWLAAQDRFRAPEWPEDWRPRPGHLGRLLVDCRSGRGTACYTCGFDPTELDPPSAALLDQVDGMKTARELCPGEAEALRLCELGRAALIR
ncbi:MAG: hypothetical protein AB1758_07025 [Candidatus Eremiobacterota bacterium]